MDNLTAATATVRNSASIASTILSFSWIDFTIFALMFGVSIIIGIYFGCFGTKQSSTSEYLLGSRAMAIFPIAMSLIASHLSGITLLGTPAEVYMYGTQYWACLFTLILIGAAIIKIYLPVFYTLKVNSSYQYLKLRFGEKIRLMALILYVIQSLLHIPLVIYIPALAFNQVSGIEIHKVTPIICGICIFYTTIGGLKAVVWTDTIQFTLTLIVMFIVFFMGIISVGGFGNIWEATKQGDRLEFFNMDLNPTTRTTFWGILFGLGTHWISSLGVNPSSVQRFLAVPTLKKAQWTVILFCIGIAFSKTLCCFFGIIMYTKYKDCDPLSSGKIKRIDQILLYYVLDVAKNIPGLPGLFVAGIFSTAFSTMSTCLNTLGGTIYEDFIRRYLPPKTSDTVANNIIKITIVIAGIICVALVFIVERLGGIHQISNCLVGVTVGPLVGLFTLGMLFPSVTANGALYGSITGLISMAWLIGGFQYHFVRKNIKYHLRPMSIEKCENITMFRNVSDSGSRYPEINNDPFFVFHISFYWYPVIGASIVIIIGLLVSWLSGEENPNRFNKDLYSPIVHKYVPKEPLSYEPIPLKIENVEDFNNKQSFVKTTT